MFIIVQGFLRKSQKKRSEILKEHCMSPSDRSPHIKALPYGRTLKQYWMTYILAKIYHLPIWMLRVFIC